MNIFKAYLNVQQKVHNVMLDFSGGYEYLEQWTVQYGKFWSRDPQEADWSVQHNHILSFLSSHHFLIGYFSYSIH